MTQDRAAERPEVSVVMRRAALWIGTMLAALGALATPFAYVPNEQQQLNVIDLGTNSFHLVVARPTGQRQTVQFLAEHDVLPFADRDPILCRVFMANRHEA